jgi:hypothetical protein
MKVMLDATIVAIKVARLVAVVAVCATEVVLVMGSTE